MIKFYRKINKKSKKEMISFLQNHFRYYTMNSWNGSTSYANRMKIYSCGFERQVQDKLYELISIDEFQWDINDLIQDFTEANYGWTSAFNGRSNGYLVLYQCEYQDTGYKSYCPICGQNNYKTATDNDNRCGKCGAESRINYTEKNEKMVIYPGRSIDSSEDYQDWTIEDLRDRVSIVQKFDALCDSILEECNYFARNYDIKSEIYTVKKERKVLVMAGENI